MGQLSEAVDLAIRFEGIEEVETVQSVRQKLELHRHPKLGLIFVINGEVQHVQAWQALYHEPIVHVPAAFVPHIRRALILGGGSLFAATELLRYPTLETCVLVDHDPAVLALMARHYVHARAVVADKRFVYVASDALAFVQASTDPFDLIVNDSIDLLSADVRGSAFGLLSRRLAPQGTCADLIYRHLYDGHHIGATRRILNALGPSAQSLILVPEYPGVLHLLTVWGSPLIEQDARVPINRVQQGWSKNGRPAELEFYDPRFLAFHLYVPPFVEREWKRDLRNSTDEGTAEA